MALNPPAGLKSQKGGSWVELLPLTAPLATQSALGRSEVNEIPAFS